MTSSAAYPRRRTIQARSRTVGLLRRHPKHRRSMATAAVLRGLPRTAARLRRSKSLRTSSTAAFSARCVRHLSLLWASPPSQRQPSLNLKRILSLTGTSRLTINILSCRVVSWSISGAFVGAQALLCDLARPKVTGGSRAARTPAILGIHGGCWRGGHKRDTSTIVVTQWAQQFGFCAMSLEYRLVGAAAAPACYQDVQCALRYLHANADELNIDTERIFVIGQSAGGHLAALCATLGDDILEKTGGWEDASSAIAAAIPVAGPYELEPEDGACVHADRLLQQHDGRQVISVLLLCAHSSVPFCSVLTRPFCCPIVSATPCLRLSGLASLGLLWRLHRCAVCADGAGLPGGCTALRHRLRRLPCTGASLSLSLISLLPTQPPAQTTRLW